MGVPVPRPQARSENGVLCARTGTELRGADRGAPQPSAASRSYH